ncbi:MAG: trigger factor [Bacteroidetes bacterium HGW-Bacteroidetes-17]|jgi:trigger factor|nr:MAG: trigger factor [Bacteroidetes bacterium HGW-Bacteroidetes-17]
MNITQENTSDLTAIIKIELLKEDYQEKVKTLLKDYQRKANVPGFRPGKVPFGMINKLYGKSVLAEEVNKLISDSLNQYIIDNKIDILGYPLPNTEKTTELDFDTQEKFEFFFDIGLTPQFEISLDDKFKVNYYNIKADEDIVNKYLSDLRGRNGKTSKPETAEESDKLFGDFVEVDAKGMVIEGGLKGSSQLKLENIKLKTALTKFIGAKKGDQITFNPAKALKSDIEVAALLGLNTVEAADFKNDIQLTISEIDRTELAELNEDFFKLVYPQDKIEDEKQLKERIKKDAEASFQSESDRQFMNNAVEMLIEKADISVPDEFLKRWLLENNQDKVTPEQLELQYDSYIKSLKWQLIESKIVKGHSIEVKEEEVRNHIKGYFMNMTMPGSEENDERMNTIVNSIMENKEEVRKIYDQLYDKKLLDFFKSNIKQVKKEVNYEEFVKLATQIK